MNTMKIETTQPTSAGCNCMGWCREGSQYWTDHHIRCDKHIPGTIVVSKVTLDGASYYDHRIVEALEEQKHNPEATIESVVVKQSDYEALPEFDGF